MSRTTQDNSLDILAAAARLGLSPETVRKRLQRGKLQGFKTPDGLWRVVLPSLDNVQDSPGQQPGQRPDNAGQGPNRTEQASDKTEHEPNNAEQPASDLVTALRDEVAFLRSQLQSRDDEIRRAHVLLQQAQQQTMAALSLPRPEPGVGRRPWWRRFWPKG